MTHRRDLYFDSGRPYGPLSGDDWCEHGNKWVQFHSKTSSGYELGMQLSALDWTEPDMKHVITLELTGMKQDHGNNAIAVVMNADDPKGRNDMFHDPDPHDSSLFHKLSKHTLSLDSQFECAWPNTRFTLVIDPADGKVVTYIEPCDECPGETWSHRFRPASASALRERRTTSQAQMPFPSPCGRPRRPPGLIWATASRCAATTRRGSRARASQMWESECPAPTTTEPPLWPPALVFSTRWPPVRATGLAS